MTPLPEAGAALFGGHHLRMVDGFLAAGGV
jgi:hypothetical protein